MLRTPQRWLATTAAAAALAGVTAPASSASVPRPVAAIGCSSVVVAAGDMNHLPQTQATGRLAQAHHPDLVATLGDQQYPSGSLTDYLSIYDTTGWGALKPRTRPVPGHHEYDTPGASGYFAYFKKPAFYAYRAGCGWRGYALNSLIPIGPQVAWLRADLAAHPGVPVVASWADPRYSSGTKHGGEPKVQPFWDALALRTGVVLNGHEHNYERFAPRGRLREFVAGTGGSSTYPFGASPAPGSQKRITGTPGVLILRLQAGGRYTWRFTNVRNVVRDSGSA